MSSNWSIAFRYWILTVLTILLGLFVWFARELISPLIIGGLLAFILNPATDFLQKRTRLSHSLSVSIVVLLGLSAIVGLLAILLPTLITEAQFVAGDLQQILTDVQAFIAKPVNILGWQIDFRTILPDFSNMLAESFSAIPESAVTLLEATSRNLIWSLVILVSSYYLLRDWSQLRDWVFGLFPPAEQEDARHIYQKINSIWLGYFRGNLLLMAIVGTVFTLVWSILGLPGAIILGLLSGLLTIIPDLGPAIAAFIAILVALVEGSNTLPLSNLVFAILVTVLYLLLMNGMSLWLRPRIFGRSVHMHDGLVFIAIMAAIVLQGILAGIIIVPVIASLGVLGRYFFRRLQGLPFSE